jgi:GNAT superfamily N-acetyltransferase
MLRIDEYRDGDFDGFSRIFRCWDAKREVDLDLLKASISEARAAGYRIFLARDDADLVGYIQIGKGVSLGAEPYLEVVQVLVAENRRGGGIGRALMETAEREARAEGLGSVRLNSQVHRSKAHVFYEALGYDFFKISKFYEKNLK